MLWGKENQIFLSSFSPLLSTHWSWPQSWLWPMAWDGLRPSQQKCLCCHFFLPQKGALSSSEPRGFLGVVTIRRDFLRLGHDCNGFTYLILLNLPTVTLIEIPGPDLDLFHLASLFWSPPFHLFPNEDLCRSRGSGIHPIPKCWGYKNSTFCWHQAGTRV